MKTRIDILNNNHQATLTGISGTLFINIPTYFGQCKATNRNNEREEKIVEQHNYLEKMFIII